MKATMYMSGKDEPVAVFDEVQVVTMNDNHKASPTRIFYKSQRLNASEKMVEMYRHLPMLLKLEDGSECSVLLQHSSLDMAGNAVGVLRVLNGLQEE